MRIRQVNCRWLATQSVRQGPAVRLRFIKAGLVCLFGVLAGAAIKFALDQAFQKLGHSDVVILRHSQHQDFGFGGDPKLNFLGFFPNEFWH